VPADDLHGLDRDRRVCVSKAGKRCIEGSRILRGLERLENSHARPRRERLLEQVDETADRPDPNDREPRTRSLAAHVVVRAEIGKERVDFSG
jgi:hypothetical protein